MIRGSEGIYGEGVAMGLMNDLNEVIHAILIEKFIGEGLFLRDCLLYDLCDSGNNDITLMYF